VACVAAGRNNKNAISRNMPESLAFLARAKRA
jgi:hypothetical protein